MPPQAANGAELVAAGAADVFTHGVTFNDPPTAPQSLRGDSTGPGIGLIDVGRAPERTARIQLESGETEE